MKILLADDSKTTRIQLSGSLTKLGHNVKMAANGQEAIELFRTQHPDLVLLDVIMEGIDGFECARRIRTISADDWVPIIFLSGAVDDENIERGINAGGDDYLAKPYSEITLAAKIKAMQRIAEMRKKLFDTTRQLGVLSATDPLTGIYNRLQFDRVIREKITHSKQHKKSIALLFVDLDHFKSVNDSLGHFVGDLLLKEVTRRLQACLQKKDFIARLGGDEFAVILGDIKSPEDAGEIARQIISHLALPCHLAGNEVLVTSSIGIACYPATGVTESSLVTNADIAMYHAKASGRNNYQFFTEQLNDEHLKRVEMENALKAAMENNEFYITYQPVIALESGKMARMEALIYWKHPTMGLVSPDIFIPLAEESGLIDTIGKWVLRTVCEQVKQWEMAGFDNFRISCNLSPAQLLQKNLPDIIADIMQDTHANPEKLELELTETSALVYSSYAEDTLKKIHELGINLTLDDFGTGYSSLTHLKYLPVSAIKIDRSFIQDIDTDPGNTRIVSSLIAFGNSLDLDVIAEGIETESQLQFLTEHHCKQGQGYYFSKPLLPNEMTDFLAYQKRLPHKVT